ncbi:MAG: hypothetical protein J6Q69_03765 [Clostridia bacterium]|nr:hypothetical protein [Clostridia bacterium]
MTERELAVKRFIELARKSEHGYFTFTDFLGLAEQSAFREAAREIGKTRYTLFGGAEGTERIMVRFGDPEELGYTQPHPISILKISPRSEKYAEKLTHRSYLGATLNLGIEREVIGDIVVRHPYAYLFCKEDIAEYIKDNLTRVSHTDVFVEIIDNLPEGELYKTELCRVQTVGERLDAIIAKLYHLSRDDANALFKKSLVFAEGREITNNSYIPKIGETISVRTLGRFQYLGPKGTTRSGRLSIELSVYV